MSNALLTMPAVATDDGIEASHHNNVAANIRTLSRSFWDDGTPDLALSEQKKGTLWVDPTTKRLWYFRIDGAGDPRDAATPVSGHWLFDDFDGPPPIDARVQDGDSFLFDDGTDSYVQHFKTGRGFWGRGVLAEYRTAATALAPDQASQRLTMRSSRWDTSGTPAAQDRDWSLYCHTSPSGGNGYSLLHIDRRHNGGSWTNVATLDTNGWLYLAGGVPGIEVNSGGAGSAFLSLYSSDPDGSLLKFRHGNATRWGRLRCYGTTAGDVGTAAEVLGVSYRTAAASGGDALRNSPSFVHRAAAWDGAASVELASYSQLVPTDSTSGYLRRGFDFGTATLDLYSTGDWELLADSDDRGLKLNLHASASGGTPTIDSPLLAQVAKSWDSGGSASHDRAFVSRVTVDSAVASGDAWTWLLMSSPDFGSFDPRFSVSSAGHVGAGTASPGTSLHAVESLTITGGVTDGYAGALRLEPTYTAATAQTVTRHNYLDLPNVVATGAGPAAVTTACVLRLDAALGTHKATTNADKTGNAKSGTLVVNVNGTLYDIQLYAH